jgi:glycosyltransferase involved in cell wall biosynthesis
VKPSLEKELKRISNERGFLENAPRNPGLISVCIANHNKADYLEECLKSIAGQDYPNVELIFVDDCSTDSSVEVYNQFIRKHGKQFYAVHDFMSKRRLGNAWAINTAYYLAQGEFIAQMDSDDIATTNRLSTQLPYLIKGGYDLVGCNFNIFERDPKRPARIGSYWLKFKDDEIKNCLKNQTHCICFGTILFKASVIEEVGGLTKKFVGTEDWEFIDRVFRSGMRIGNLRTILYYYRSHPEQRSKLFHKTLV